LPNLQPYSLVIAAGGLLIVVGFVLLGNKKPRLVDWLAFGGITLALSIAWLAVRPVERNLTGDAASVQKMIGAGKPVMLEFQSPF
jgi:hypothetical protein